MTIISFNLSHKGGANEEIYAADADTTPIPRVGEFVSIGDVSTAFVRDVNYRIDEQYQEATVYLLCDGSHSRCSWGCDRQWYRQEVDKRR